MKEVLNAIFARIKSEVPEVTFIDINVGQLLLEQPPVAFPCVLVDISTIEYSMFKSAQQKASATIGIQFGFNILGASDINSPAELRDLTMDHYRIIERVANALHLYSCDYFSPLIRQSLRREQNNYPRTFSLSFTTNWYEVTQI